MESPIRQTLGVRENAQHTSGGAGGSRPGVRLFPPDDRGAADTEDSRELVLRQTEPDTFGLGPDHMCSMCPRLNRYCHGNTPGCVPDIIFPAYTANVANATSAV